MNADKSWNKPFQSYDEIAIETVRKCVSLITGSTKTDTALRDLAPTLGITHRRMRTLYHRDGTPTVRFHEWMALRFRAGLFYLNWAKDLRALADKCDRIGDDLVSTQLEFSWEAEWNANDGSLRPQQQRCA